MKQLLTFIAALLLTSSSLSAQQLETFLDGLSGPARMATQGNDLYFIEYGEGGQISKVDVSADNPVAEVVISGAAYPHGLVIYDNILYISAQGTDNILTYRLDEPEASLEVFMDGLSAPTNMAIYEEALYVSDTYNNRIVFKNLDEPEASKKVLVEGVVNPDGIAVYDGYLYISEQTLGRISRVSLTEEEPEIELVSSGFSFVTQITVHDGQLYTADFGSDKVEVFDLTEEFPLQEELTNLVNRPDGVQVIGDYLYIGEYSGGRISRILVDNLVSSVVNTTPSTDTYCYPNPTKNVVFVASKAKYLSANVYDALGKEVLRTSVNTNNSIDFGQLAAGTYMVVLDGKDVFRVVKR